MNRILLLLGCCLSLMACSGGAMSESGLEPGVRDGMWRLVAFVSADGTAPEAPEVESRLTVDTATGKLSGLAACNRFSADYTADGDALKIGAIAATKRYCAGAYMTQERRFLEWLGRVETAGVAEGILELRTAEGERLRFELVPEA